MIVETFSVCCSSTICTHYKKLNTFLIMYAAFFVKRIAEHSTCVCMQYMYAAIQVYSTCVCLQYIHGTAMHEYSTCVQHILYMYSIQM